MVSLHGNLSQNTGLSILSYLKLIITSTTRDHISDAYQRVVNKLGFNDGITDDKNKVVFHTLRHTYASWLVMNGVDLYTTQKLMGHKSNQMTQRYAHLAPGHLEKAVNTLGRI